MTTIADIAFTEAVDLDALAHVVEHFDKLDANAKTLANNYLLASADGSVKVHYRQAAPHGRWYAIHGLSLQSMKRCVRHTICTGKYQDIDIVNAQPTMIQHLCRENEVDCPHLDEYVSNRDALLDALESDEPKAIYLAVMNGGSCDKAPNKTTHLKAFKNEMCTIAQALKNKYASRFKEVKERRVAKGKLDEVFRKLTG